MATRQFYSAESTSESSITSGTGVWTEKAALTFTPDASAVYYIFASWVMRSNSILGPYFSRLRQTSSTPVTHNANYIYPKDDTNYRPVFGVGIYTAPSSPSAETFKIEYQRVSTFGSIFIREARLAALKKGANDHHASHNGEEYTTSTSFVDSSCTLTFTPESQGDYIIIAVADMGCSSTLHQGYVVLNIDGTDYEMGQEAMENNTNRVNVGTVRKINFTAASHTLKIQFRTENASNTVVIAAKGIIALRVSDFNGEYTSSNTTRATTTSSTYQNYASQSPTLTAGNHLILSSILYDNNSTSYDARIVFDSDGTYLIRGNVEAKSANTKYAALMLCNRNYTAGQKTIRWRYSSSSNNTTGVDEATITLLALEASGNTYTRNCNEVVALADTRTNRPGKTFSEIIDPVDTFTRVISALRTFTERVTLIPTGRSFINESMTSPPTVGTLAGHAVYNSSGYISLAPTGGNKLGTYELDAPALTAQGRYFEVQFEVYVNAFTAGQLFGFYFDFGTTPTSELSSGGRMVHFDFDDDMVYSRTNGFLEDGVGPIHFSVGGWTKVRLKVDVDLLTYLSGSDAWENMIFPAQNLWETEYTPAGGKLGFIGKTVNITTDEIRIRNVKVFSTHGASLQTNKPLNESIAIVDTNTQTIAPTQTCNEAVAIVDALSKQGIKTIPEVLTIADTRTNRPSKTLNDTVTLAQVYTSLQNKMLTQTITIADNRSHQTSKTLSQVVAIADIRNNKLNKNFAEVVSMVDTITRVSQKTLFETLAIADVLIRSGSKTFAEAITIAENLQRTLVLLRILNEAITISETLTSFKLTIKDCTESISIIDSLIRASSKTFTEVIDSADTITKQTGKTFSEVVNHTDTITKTSSKTLTQMITLAESISRITNRTFGESVAIVETILKGLPAKTYSEVITLFQTLAKRNYQTFNESITLQEALSKTKSKNLAEAVILVWDFIIVSDKIKECTEAITVADSIINVGSKNFIEAVVLVESLDKAVAQAKTLAEALSIVDSLIRLSVYHKIFGENVIIVDTQTIVSAINAAISFLYDRSIGYQGVYSAQNSVYTNSNEVKNTSYSNVYTNQNTEYDTVYDPQSYH